MAAEFDGDSVHISAPPKVEEGYTIFIWWREGDDCEWVKGDSDGQR